MMNLIYIQKFRPFIKQFANSMFLYLFSLSFLIHQLLPVLFEEKLFEALLAINFFLSLRKFGRAQFSQLIEETTKQTTVNYKK